MVASSNRKLGTRARRAVPARTVPARADPVSAGSAGPAAAAAPVTAVYPRNFRRLILPGPMRRVERSAAGALPMALSLPFASSGSVWWEILCPRDRIGQNEGTASGPTEAVEWDWI